jgi:hypothetical protein
MLITMIWLNVYKMKIITSINTDIKKASIINNLPQMNVEIYSKQFISISQFVDKEPVFNAKHSLEKVVPRYSSHGSYLTESTHCGKRLHHRRRNAKYSPRTAIHKIHRPLVIARK